MDAHRIGQELGRLFGVVQDARHLSATRWRQQPAAPGAPLAVRLAVHHGATMGELRRAFPGFDLIPDENMAVLVLLGVVKAGENAAEVEAASGVMLR